MGWAHLRCLRPCTLQPPSAASRGAFPSSTLQELALLPAPSRGPSPHLPVWIPTAKETRGKPAALDGGAAAAHSRPSTAFASLAPDGPEILAPPIIFIPVVPALSSSEPPASSGKTRPLWSLTGHLTLATSGSCWPRRGRAEAQARMAGLCRSAWCPGRAGR